MSLLARLKNLFKLGKLLSVDDSGNVRVCTARYLGKDQQIVLFTPYGLMHNPPIDSFVCVADQMALPSNGVGVADAPADRTLKDLKEGEVAVGNYLTGDYIKFDEDGMTTLKNAKSTIKAYASGNVIIDNEKATITMQNDGRIELRNTIGAADDSRIVITKDGVQYMFFSGSNQIRVDSGGITITGNVNITGTLTNNTVDVGSTHYHWKSATLNVYRADGTAPPI